MITEKSKPCDAVSLPPPVPPRRRKKSRGDGERPSSVTPHRKPERKHRAPTPPVPHRTRRAPSPAYPSLESTASGYDSEDAKPDKRPRKSILSKKSAGSSPYTKPPDATNYHPPLYFTYQDYQMVMETKPTEDRKSDDDRSDFSLFMENVTFNDPREEIYFRVTTTTRPFEKCLVNWNKHDADARDEEEERSDLYIFEDYMDRSNKLNARPHLLYTEEFSSGAGDDNSAASNERSTTKVRFLIESPSTSTPDADLDDDGKSYGEFVKKQLESEDSAKTTIVELTEEEVQKLGEELTRDKEDVSEAARAENFSESLQVQNTNLTIDSCSDLEEDTELQSMNTADVIKDDVEVYEELEDVYDKDKVKSPSLSPAPKKVEPKEEARTPEVPVEPAVGKDEISVQNKVGMICERRKIYIDSSCYKLSNEETEEWQECDNPSGKLDSLEELKILIDPTLSNVDDTIDQPAVNFVETEEAISKKVVPTIEIWPEEEEEIAVAASSRNSFLDSMLAGDNNSPTNCEVIAAHPKQQSKNEVPRNAPGIESAADRAGSQPPQPSDNKTTGEVKCDVLNELLTNFSSIKLKPTKTEESHKPLEIKTDDVIVKEEEKKVEVKVEDSNSDLPKETVSKPSCAVSEEEKKVEVKVENSVSDLPKETVNKSSDVVLKKEKKAEIKVESKKTEDLVSNLPREAVSIPSNVVSEEEKAADIKVESKKTENSISNLLTETVCKPSSIAKKERKNEIKVEPKKVENLVSNPPSAIVKEATHNDSVDNKSSTAPKVDVVSKDEPVSITRGSVRSFVKYYEIHSEINNIAKIKDDLFQKQKELKKKIKSPCKTPEETSKKSTRNKVPEKLKPTPPPVAPKQSCIKSSSTLTSSPNLERRKSVQFAAAVNLPSQDGRDQTKGGGEKTTFTPGIKTGKTSVKSEKIDKPDRRQHPAVICIQGSPKAEAVSCAEKPGNRNLLPKTEHLQNNPAIVFYCTV